MIMDLKTSNKGHIFEIEIYTWTESWINKFYIDCYDRTMFGRYTTIWKSGAWGCIEKIAFKVVQMKQCILLIKKFKFLYVYGSKFTKYLHGTWSLLNILMISGIK